jgi:hypothetical protein
MYFLFFVLCRVLLLLWGINKFTKKLIRPWAINNNELVDFISRVPDNEELVCSRFPDLNTLTCYLVNLGTSVILIYES